MGGCCFTPRKRQLLWWYWLLLFSVVGIPMFAAALYVQRAARHGVVASWQVRRASRLFWLGTFSSFMLVAFVAYVLARGSLWNGRLWAPTLFVASFGFWLVVAVTAAKATERAHPRYARLAVLACCFLVPAVLAWLPHGLLTNRIQAGIGLLALGAMKFLVCMLPAHFWYRFTTAPSTKRAWLFLVALAVGTALFWAVSRYGDSVHAGVHQWVTSIGFHRL